MKKVLLIAVAAVFLTSFSGFAQDAEPSRKNVVKINPLGLLFGGINASYERVFSENFSAQLGGSFSSSTATVNGASTDINGLGVTAMVRWYFAPKVSAPAGWYLAPRFQYGTLTDGDGNGVNTLGIGGVAGYQWAWDSGFALDLFLGAQNIGISTVGDASGASIEGILPVLGLSLGFAF